MAGDPDAIVNMGKHIATYLIYTMAQFDDGAIAHSVFPLERTVLGTMESVAWKTPTVISHDCRNMQIVMQNFTATSGRTLNPAFFDGNGSSVIGSFGVIFNGEVPETESGLGFPITLGFDSGLDVAQWSDIPSDRESYQICGAAFTMINCNS